jgi:hypothetical protein
MLVAQGAQILNLVMIQRTLSPSLEVKQAKMASRNLVTGKNSENVKLACKVLSTAYWTNEVHLSLAFSDRTLIFLSVLTVLFILP